MKEKPLPSSSNTVFICSSIAVSISFSTIFSFKPTSSKMYGSLIISLDNSLCGAGSLFQNLSIFWKNRLASHIISNQFDVQEPHATNRFPYIFRHTILFLLNSLFVRKFIDKIISVFRIFDNQFTDAEIHRK